MLVLRDGCRRPLCFWGFRETATLSSAGRVKLLPARAKREEINNFTIARKTILINGAHLRAAGQVMQKETEHLRLSRGLPVICPFP